MADPVVVTNPDLLAQIGSLNAALTQISAFLSHMTIGGATSHALEWAKGKPSIARWWELLGGRGKTVVGGILAAMGSLGISAVFASDPNQRGVYILTLSGLTAASVGSHLWSFAQSWILQQGWYSAIVKPRTVTGIQTAPGVEPKPQAPIPVAVESVNTSGVKP
jgi:hypothetical protein